MIYFEKEVRKMEENIEIKESINKEDLKKELESYKKRLVEIQDKINELTLQRENLYRLGLRIEGIISFLNEKLEQSDNK